MPRFQELGLVVVVFVMTALLVLYGWHDAVPGEEPANTFFNLQNLVEGIALPMSYYAIMAVGMTVVVIAGGIDISVGSIMALAGLITAYVLLTAGQPPSYWTGPKASWFDKNFIHWLATAPAWMTWAVSLVLPLLIGLLCGLFNGVLVVGLKMHPFIVTLGTMAIFRWMCNTLPFGGATLNVPERFLNAGSATAQLNRLSFGEVRDGMTIGGVQIWPLVFMLITGVLGWIYLSLTVWGRQTYAVGGNEEAARFSGIPVGLVKLRVYAISGLCAGLAGLVSLGRFGTISKNTASGYELVVVAATVVGGASLAGGRGTALGALLGALILSMIDDAIGVLKLNQEHKLGIVGASIIVAVVLDSVSQAIRKRRAIKG